MDEVEEPLAKANAKAARACSKGALPAKNPTLRRRKTLLCGKSYAMVSMQFCIAANLPSSGRKGDRLRWKEPAGDFMANSHDVIPAFPVDGEGGPRERWMRSRSH